MKTKKIILVSLFFPIICLLFNNDVIAQISKGGAPPSFSIPYLQDTVAVIQMPTVNVDSLIQNDTLSDYSFRFGYAIDVNLGFNNSGTWDTLQSGDKIWRLKINSPSAFSINFIFDDFWLPEDAQFFVYNEDKSMVIGAFTSDVSNNPHNKFATDLIKGDVVVLEYFEPSHATGGRINVDKVIHGYVNTFSGHGNSGSCNIDITCSQGNEWCVEKRTTSLILTSDNTRFCTGCLINNVREDLTPYYLTANHCISGDPSTWVFRFKYWSPTCNQGDDAGHWVSITGSTLRANHAATDFALLQLNSPPPSGFGVLYAGWDRTATPATSATAIHHPRGDVMKISHDFNTLSAVSWVSGAATHWRATFDQGIVQHGSSGSPLFNQNHKVIGQLHGNQNNQCSTTDNSCHCSQTPIGEYGRFDVSWNGGGTPQTRLRDWLDPDNTGATSIRATSPTIYLINRTLTGTHKFAALEEIHIEGNVPTAGPRCQPSNIPFTAESGSNVTIKAKSITIHPETEFKEGSNVVIEATDEIECTDNIVEGDYVNVFCKVQISIKMAGGNSNFASTDENLEAVLSNDEDIKVLNLSDNITLYPNPNSGRFEIAFSDKEVKFSEIIIFDMTGKIVFERHNITENKIPIDICHLQRGIYIVQIIHSGKSHTKKIVLN